jgi:hypothetical protein
MRTARAIPMSGMVPHRTGAIAASPKQSPRGNREGKRMRWSGRLGQRRRRNGSAARPSSSAERRDHLSREPLELLRVVDERVEQDQLRTGVRHGTDAADAPLGRAREDVF